MGRDHHPCRPVKSVVGVLKMVIGAASNEMDELWHTRGCGGASLAGGAGMPRDTRHRRGVTPFPL
jgi:hypothetical protein